MKISQSRMVAATTPSDQIAPGTPEEAYQSINRAKMLWSFRRRDVNDWKEVIDRWSAEPKAWKRIPEIRPYGTAKAMIEAEVCESYDAFFNFVADVVGTDYAAKIADNYADRPGPQSTDERKRNESGQFVADDTHPNPYVHKDLDGERKESKYGTHATYLLDRIAKEHPSEAANIGKGKQYKTVHEAAKKLGIVKDRPRVHIYIDDPAAAAKTLAKYVDKDWMIDCIDAYMRLHEPPTA